MCEFGNQNHRMTGAPIYLDNNATSRMDRQVAEVMFELACSGVANPASQHRSGRQALRELESAKFQTLRSVGANVEGMDADQILLTSGGTEANNLALYSATYEREGLVIIGSMEHPSLLQAAETPEICLNPVRYLRALPNGQYDLDQLDQWLGAIYGGRDEFQRVALVSLMLANNETGVMNELSEIVRLCRRYDVPVHSDIVQAVGKIEFDMRATGASSVTIAAHKVHGPVGIGALIVGANAKVRPMIVGGGQQLGWRAGTEPVVLASGMAKAFELAEQARRDGTYRDVSQLRDELEKRLVAQLDRVFIQGELSPRVPQTSNLAFEGLDRQALQMALDLAGVSCSTGSACASGSSRPSTTLLAMGLSEARVAGSLRFSLSRFTTVEEMERAVEIVIRVVEKQKASG